MGVIASTLTPEQIAEAQQQAQGIANSATPIVQKGRVGMAWVDSNYDGKLVRLTRYSTNCGSGMTPTATACSMLAKRNLCRTSGLLN